MTALLDRKKPTFRSGIHPEEFKEYTRDLPVERMPFQSEYIFPLAQHLGAPATSLVRPGQKVFRGQKIAEASGFVSTPIHASITGRVVAIEPRNNSNGGLVESIVIHRDPYSTQSLLETETGDWRDLDNEEILKFIREGGFVGLGGAAFPTHVKLAVPEGKRAQFFMINGSECEPYLNSDFRLMLEHYDSLFYGIRICLQVLGAEKAYIGLENNKPEAVEALLANRPDDLPCEIVPLQTKYPQGAEKMMIDAVLHREVPSGKLPIDVQVVVNNVGTVAAIGDLFRFGRPLIERIVTVTGPGIRRPANLMVPLGTKLSAVLEHCGGLTEDARQILFGGPMMGAPQRALDVPVVKGTSGIVVLTDREILPRRESPCIRCMRCVDACPVFLNPSRLGALARIGRYEEMKEYHILDCMECGSCSFVCPSQIPLVQRFRVSKAFIREQAAREKESAK